MHEQNENIVTEKLQKEFNKESRAEDATVKLEKSPDGLSCKADQAEERIRESEEGWLKLLYLRSKRITEK